MTVTVTVQPPGGIERLVKLSVPLCPEVKEFPATPPQLPPAFWLALIDILAGRGSLKVAPVRVIEFALLSEKVMVEGPLEVIEGGANALPMPAGAR